MDRFLSLVRRVHEGSTPRSENDLSSRLAGVVEDLGLHPVVDTSVSSGSRKRPDVLAYASEEDADLVAPAEVVVEAKKPAEVEGYPDLAAAIVGDRYWHEKTHPYLKDNISRVRYFAFTTFTEFAVFAVSREIREDLVESFRSGEASCEKLRERIRNETLSFRLHDEGEGPDSASAWVAWARGHLVPEALGPVPLSETRNSVAVADAEDLEALASRLALFAAGSTSPTLPDSGMFQSIRGRLGEDYDALDPAVRRDLLVFAMAQRPGLETTAAEKVVREDVAESLREFVAASIHSLMSRLFATKAIEDAFCVGEEDPLVEPELWLFATDAYDALDAEEVRAEVFRRLRGLADSENEVVRNFARYGFFFDWIEGYVDPVVLRSLLETFSVHDFSRLEEDLLGRFYELYAQDVDRNRRKALGQYYTPMDVVRFMWRAAVDIVEARGENERLQVLDPATGSATFLTEGARVLAQSGVERFWERLTGFDIAAQLLGVAYVNVYMAVLSQVSRGEALEVGDLRLYATDALDHQTGGHLLQVLPLIEEEGRRALLEQSIEVSLRAKREGSYRLVIGNPPYHNNSALTLGQVSDRFPRLLGSSVAAGGARRRNIRDDYAWFLAAADRYVGERGVICFIVSDSFASRASYEHFRAELLRHYYVRLLVRLGEHVFSDVGYRTSFAVVLLEKREEPLGTADEADPVPYHDLRALAEEADANDLGTPKDPRLSLLRSVARGEASLGEPELHAPSPAAKHSFYPATGVLERLTSDGVVLLHENSGPRLFAKKWPGIITAFDPFFKGTREGLEERLSSFFAVCRTEGIRAAEFERRIERWGEERGFEGDDVAKLLHLGAQVRNSRDLRFDPTKIKRSFSGSIPASARWYPSAEHVHYLYYESRLTLERNLNPGKAKGWGNMGQWREPPSHDISPKLIYTTAARAQNGYAAFVVDDEWYVKLHGGTSQQFNYTGLDNPGQPGRADGSPNNLAQEGSALLSALLDAGGQDEALLFYVAAVWNSALAAELLASVGSSARPGVRVPGTPAEVRMALEVAGLARTARDLTRLAQLLGESETLTRLPASSMDPWLSGSLASELGFVRTAGGRRFKAEGVYEVPNGAQAIVAERMASTEARIEELVEALHP